MKLPTKTYLMLVIFAFLTHKAQKSQLARDSWQVVVNQNRQCRLRAELEWPILRDEVSCWGLWRVEGDEVDLGIGVTSIHCCSQLD